MHAKNISVVRTGKHLVDQASLETRPGELSVIVGPNGAGKSTLLKVLTGDLQADSGSVQYDGTQLETIAPEDLARRRAVLAQSTSLTFDFTVSEVVMLGRIPHLNGWESPDDRRAARDAIEAVEMEDFINQPYTTLSGGEAQRVHLARVLAQLDFNQPKKNAEIAPWLFLDEPTSALDLRHQHTTLGLVKELTRKHGFGAVAVLHDLSLTMHYADHVVMMSGGKIAAEGSPEDTLTPQLIADVYGVKVETYHVSADSRPFIHIVEANSESGNPFTEKPNE
ncbi:MAG: heme ABC transporter ATP-binding protein [Opitutales bacterium]